MAAVFEQRVAVPVAAVVFDAQLVLGKVDVQLWSVQDLALIAHHRHPQRGHPRRQRVLVPAGGAQTGALRATRLVVGVVLRQDAKRSVLRAPDSGGLLVGLVIRLGIGVPVTMYGLSATDKLGIVDRAVSRAGGAALLLVEMIRGALGERSVLRA